MLAHLLLAPLAWAAPGPHVTPWLPDRWAHDAVWMGGAWEASTPGIAEDVGVLWDGPVQLDLAMRNVADGPALAGTSVSHRLRLSRDETGRTVIDELSLQGRVTGLAIRPAMGDRLDLSVVGGRWDQNLFGLARPWTHLQVYLPLHLVGVGFSDTDADDDIALRYYAAAGAGLGADWTVRVGGPIGLHLRAEIAADTLHRLRRERRDQVRHEVWGRAELDLVLIDDQMPFSFGAWAEQRAQWETRDGPVGVDRQVLAGGLRFGLKLFRGRGILGGPDEPWATPGAPPDIGAPPGVGADPGNRAAARRGTKRHARANARNAPWADSPAADVPDEPTPPWPPSPEEHEATNEANE